MLCQPGRVVFEQYRDRPQRAVALSLTRWAPPRATPAATPPPAYGTPEPGRHAVAVAPAPTAPFASSQSPAAGAGVALKPSNGALGATLRRGDVGCAHLDAPWMTATDRDACRDHLAAGAAKTPYLSGTAPEKLAYYAAVAKAEEDWRSGRDAGHPPFILCGKALPHALKLGPCYLEPPKGSLDLDVDIPPPDTSRHAR
jgi:hypothetical protein